MSHYHDILGVRPGASQEEIKNAFRERALECHPDRAEDGQKKEAQEEFVRVREAFEILSDDKERRGRDTSSTNGTGTAGRSGRTHRPYKEEWRKYKNQKVHIGKDIVDNVRGLSNEYDLIRQKNWITVPVCSLAGAVLYLYDPMTIYGTGIFFVDVLLCGLVGSVYGFAVGSIWAYVNLFFKDAASE